MVETTWQMDQQQLEASVNVLREYMDDNGAGILLRVGHAWVPLLEVDAEKAVQQAWQGPVEGVCLEGRCPTMLYSLDGVELGALRLTRDPNVGGLVLFVGSRAVLAVAGPDPKSLPNGLLHLEAAEMSADAVRRLAGLPVGKSLISLDVGGSEALASSTDLSFLEPFQRLGGLDVGGFGRLENVEPLVRLTGLVQLGLEGCTSLRDLKPLAALRKLESLDLSGCTAIEDLSPLAMLTSLRTLDLSGCSRVKSLEPLSDLPALAELKLVGCERLPNLAPLVRILSLVSLDLSDCETLLSVGALRACGSLEELVLAGCPHVRDVAALGDARSLRSLVLDHQADAVPVLAACAVLRVDAACVAEQIGGWVDQLELATDKARFVDAMLSAIALGQSEPWTREALQTLVARARTVGNLPRDAWKSLFSALLAAGEPVAQRGFEIALASLPPAGDPEPILGPALEALAKFQQAACPWGHRLADTTLDALLPTTRGPSVAGSAVRFYARTLRAEALEPWLALLTQHGHAGGAGPTKTVEQDLPNLEDDPAALSGLIARLVQKQADSPPVAQLVAALAGLARQRPESAAVERMVGSVSHAIRDLPDNAMTARLGEVFATLLAERPECAGAQSIAQRVVEMVRVRPEHPLTKQLGHAFLDLLTEQPAAPAVSRVTAMIDAARSAGLGLFARRVLGHSALLERVDAAELEAFVRIFDGREARRALIRGLIDTLCSEDILRNKPRHDVATVLERELVDVD